MQLSNNDFIPIIHTVMPVPDHVRDDGSGIQKCNAMMTNWIPGQARNDVTYIKPGLLLKKASSAGITDKNKSRSRPKPELINSLRAILILKSTVESDEHGGMSDSCIPEHIRKNRRQKRLKK